MIRWRSFRCAGRQPCPVNRRKHRQGGGRALQKHLLCNTSHGSCVLVWYDACDSTRSSTACFRSVPECLSALLHYAKLPRAHRAGQEVRHGYSQENYVSFQNKTSCTHSLMSLKQTILIKPRKMTTLTKKCESWAGIRSASEMLPVGHEALRRMEQNSSRALSRKVLYSHTETLKQM